MNKTLTNTQRERENVLFSEKESENLSSKCCKSTKVSEKACGLFSLSKTGKFETPSQRMSLDTLLFRAEFLLLRKMSEKEIENSEPEGEE